MHDAPSQPIAFTIGEEDEHLVLPPQRGGDVCSGCRSINYEGASSTCENCRLNANQLDGMIVPIEAIALYAKPGRLRDWLTFYKSEAERFEDPEATRAVRQILARFFVANEKWLQHLQCDLLVVVPSTTRRPPHPLQEILESLRPQTVKPQSVLQRTGQPLAPRQASPDAYKVESSVAGKRILLIDDVYASGARAQSAACALRNAGAEIASLLIIGRRINPGYSKQASALFSAQAELPFEWDLSRR